MSVGFKSGFVGLVGPTNSGKSTLLNALVGEKVSIVSAKPQTTMRVVKGMCNSQSHQLVFTDTPGLERPRERLSKYLNRVAESHAEQCDLLVWVFDASHRDLLGQLNSIESGIKRAKDQGKSFCVLNKVDKLPKLNLLPLMEAIHEKKLFKAVFPISALKDDGVRQMVNTLLNDIEEGPKYYLEEQVTDRTPSFRVAEQVREKIYQCTKQEVPYSVWVDVESMDVESKVPQIMAVIHVDSASRRGILIGKGGAKLKEIGIRARKEVEKMLQRQVCLKLHVHVHDDWKADERHLTQYLEMN